MKNKVVQPQDKYVLRLPDGLRDRIKAYAESHGRSMNAEIVRVLEREFPEPWTIGDRLNHLTEVLLSLKKGETFDQNIFQMVDSIEQTIAGILSGRVEGVNDDARDALSERYNQYLMERDENDDFYTEYDPEERDQQSIDGTTRKFVHTKSIKEKNSSQSNKIKDEPQRPIPPHHDDFDDALD
jgi:hypothetical protein